MNQQENENQGVDSLPHSALNSLHGADANLPLILLVNGYDYFNFEGLIDVYLENREEGIVLHVLHTGEVTEGVAEECISVETVSKSGIKDMVLHTNKDFAPHFQELIDARPKHIPASIVERMDASIELMKSKTPEEARAEKEAQVRKALELATEQVRREVEDESDVIQNIKDFRPKGRNVEGVEGELPMSANEALKDHLRKEQGSPIIKP